MNKSTKKNLTWLAIGTALFYYFSKDKKEAPRTTTAAAPSTTADLGNEMPTVTVDFEGDNPGLTTFNNGPTV